MGCTGIAPPESGVTACVLEAETGLVSLGHFTSSDDVQQVVVTEGVHAVVVPESGEQIEYNRNFFFLWQASGMPLRPQLYCVN